MIGRMLAAFGAAGVNRALLSVDLGGISSAVYRTLQWRRPGDPPWPEVEFLDGMPITQTAADTAAAVRLMVSKGARVIVCLGGDGTARVAATAVGEIPLLPVSTGTNNTFPAVREATVAGLAAGLVATGAVARADAVTRAKVLRVEAGARTETALVDVAVSTERHVGTRAVWDPATLTQLFCAFAEPDAIGLSSVLGQLSPVSRREVAGVTAVLDPRAGTRVTAPIAPGLVATVGVGDIGPLEPGVPHPVLGGQGVLAVDGEREIMFGPGRADREHSGPGQCGPGHRGAPARPVVTLRTDGPWCVDVPATLAASAWTGALVTRQGDTDA